MEFQDHLSPQQHEQREEMALHQNEKHDAAVLRSMLPHHQPQQQPSPPPPKSPPSSSAAHLGCHHQFSGSQNFLHLQQTSDLWLSTASGSISMKKLVEEEGNCCGEIGWERDKCKADVLNHPLYDQLLAAHVACLRIATPVDQLCRIDAQLSQSQNVVAKYSLLGQGQPPLDEKQLDLFMTHYVLLLSAFKEHLQQHVRVHAMEAIMACWELEQSLQSITGVAPGESTGATMSDDDDEYDESDTNLFDGGDSMGFGPLVPSESERSLMERVRQELKHELKQGYKEKIGDIREEILRKRRAGKLPGDTTCVLKAWWQSHSKWPYPTEEDKARLVAETGLQLKQINNWFINQRKRNWHTHSSSASSQKSKRQR